MITLTTEEKDILKALMKESARKRNLANSGLVLDNGKLVATAESWVASSTDATAHSERMLVAMVCQQKHSNWTPGLTMVSVVEPCIMCIGACTLAGYTELGFIIPAKRFSDKIPFLTNDTKIDKPKLASQFDTPIKLTHLPEYEDEFAAVFQDAMAWVLKKNG